MVRIASSSMAKLSIHELCVLIIITSFASIVISTTTESVKPTKKSALFVFGDSLFDPGNNQYINGSKPGASSYYPYGQTFFNHPTGRLSDGRIVPDFIALFAKLPMLTPYLQPGGDHDFTAGTNFASAGACALDAPHPQMAAIDLNEQLSYFKKVEEWLKQKLGNEEAEKLLKRAVYLFSIGGNDYFTLSSSYPNITLSYQKEYVGMVIGNLTNVLQEIYEMGGRKIAFQNAGPLGCTPGKRFEHHGNCDQLAMSLATLHNTLLAHSLKNLESHLPGFQYSIFDYYNALYDRIANPSKYALFAKLPMLGPYLEPGEHNFTDGIDFASAGSGVLGDLQPAMPINLHGQLNYFKNVEKWLKQKQGDVEAKKFLMRAVYLFSIGGNDYFRLYSMNPNATLSYQRHYSQMVIGNLTQVLEEIYAMGGRKIAFQNVGPLGCTPGAKLQNANLGGSCAEFPMALARRHNRMLLVVLKKLESQLPGFKYSIFDYYNALRDRFINPSKYSFKEGKAACCGIGTYRSSGCGGNNGTTKYELCSNPFEYVWFDAAHTTEGANRQLAKLLWGGSPKVTGPYNVKQLFAFL